MTEQQYFEKGVNPDAVLNAVATLNENPDLMEFLRRCHYDLWESIKKDDWVSILDYFIKMHSYCETDESGVLQIDYAEEAEVYIKLYEVLSGNDLLQIDHEDFPWIQGQCKHSRKSWRDDLDEEKNDYPPAFTLAFDDPKDETRSFEVHTMLDYDPALKCANLFFDSHEKGIDISKAYDIIASLYENDLGVRRYMREYERDLSVLPEGVLDAEDWLYIIDWYVNKIDNLSTIPSGETDENEYILYVSYKKEIKIIKALYELLKDTAISHPVWKGEVELKKNNIR